MTCQALCWPSALELSVKGQTDQGRRTRRHDSSLERTLKDPWGMRGVHRCPCLLPHLSGPAERARPHPIPPQGSWKAPWVLSWASTRLCPKKGAGSLGRWEAEARLPTSCIHLTPPGKALPDPSLRPARPGLRGTRPTPCGHPGKSRTAPATPWPMPECLLGRGPPGPCTQALTCPQGAGHGSPWGPAPGWGHPGVRQAGPGPSPAFSTLPPPL